MIYFKIGCYILITTCFLHLFGHFQEPLAENETEKQLLDLMTNYTMNMGSDTITMMGLQKGFSLCFSLLFLWTGFMGLFLTKNMGDKTSVIRKAAIIYTIALGIMTGISFIYFFIVPTSCIALAWLFFVVACFRIK